MIASSNRPEPLAGRTEARIDAFSDLVATAISNTEARTETKRLADEQAGLRRVATLVAREAPAPEVFAKVAEEIGMLLEVENVWVDSYETDDSVRIVGSWSTAACTSMKRPRRSRCAGSNGRFESTITRPGYPRQRQWDCTPWSAARSWSTGASGV
jgi:hypothetical protein